MLTVQAELLYSYPLPPLDEADRAAGPIVEVHDRALYNPVTDTDAVGRRWVFFTHIRGNETAGHLLLQDAAGWPEVAQVLPPPNFKIDHASARQDGTGPDLVVVLTDHAISSASDRAVQVALATIPGLLAPFSPPGAPRGLPSPVTPGPPPAPQPSEPVDYGRIQQGIAGEVTRLVGLFGGGSVRGGLQEKAEDALVWLLTVTEADAGDRWPVAQRFRDAWYSQLNNVTGAQSWKALVESGLVAPERAPAWVHGLPGFPWPLAEGDQP